MTFFRAIFCGMFLCLYVGVACAAQPSDTATRKAQGSGAYNERNADVNWKSSGSSNPCLGKQDGAACKRNGSVGAKCKNQKCVITKCDNNTYLVVVDKGNDKYVSDGYCTSRTASCKDNERLLTVDFNGAPAAVKIGGKFKCTSFDDICTTEKKNELFAVEGVPIVGTSTMEDYCRPTKCFDKYVLENAGKPNAKCVPCTPCDPTNADCELTGSNGVDQCYYETSCADGYEKEQNHDKYNPVCTEIPKPVVAPEPEPAPAPESCDPAVLNAMAATHDANGNCVATKCLDNKSIIVDGKCEKCPPCTTSTARCEVYVDNNVCKYKTTCPGDKIIENDGHPDASCVERQPDKYYITYDLDGGSGCENLSGGVANQQVSCTPTKDKFDFVGWCYDANRTNCTSGETFTIEPGNASNNKITMYAKWQEQKRTECSDKEKKQLPNAKEFRFVNDKCEPVSCEDEYELKDGQCVKNTAKTYNITYELNGGSGCDDAPKTFKEGQEIMVNCQPTNENLELEGWLMGVAGASGTEVKMPYVVKGIRDDIFFKVSGWKEKKRTECSDEEKKQFSNATKFQFVNDKCEPVSCEDEYELKDGKCVEKKRTECSDKEKKQFPNATKFQFVNDKCEPISCADGYKLENGKCVDDGVKEAEDNYKKAKERENSLENRMLGGATMAATGIGGMQLAQGLAEQSADKNAEQDMAAYLATFQCRIGDKGGKSYPGGTSNIETPGANQLINTYQEYVALAKDLSERKSALGMKPGIEAEVILDKSATGLYDDVGHGVNNGTYASLYRAAMGSETDKQKLDSDKEASSNRVKGGAIAAGGGAVGGAIGNMLINGGDDDATKKDCTQSGKVWENGKCQDVVVKGPTNKTSKRTDDTREPKVTSTANNSTQSSRTANQDNFNFDVDGTNHWGYNLGGRCAKNTSDDGDRVALDDDGACARLTKKGTWWTSFSYGIIYGDSKCGAEDEHSLVPCLCKITSVGDKKVNKSDWEKFTNMNDIEHCKRDCATQCGTYLSISKDLRKKSFTPIMKYLKK